MSDNAPKTIIPNITIPNVSANNSKAIMYIVTAVVFVVIFYLLWKYLTKNIVLVI